MQAEKNKEISVLEKYIQTFDDINSWRVLIDNNLNAKEISYTECVSNKLTS